MAVFLGAARAEHKIWPYWLAGVAMVLGAGALIFWWMSGDFRTSGHDVGGLGLAVFIIAAWVASGMAALTLAAVVAFAFKMAKRAKEDEKAQTAEKSEKEVSPG